ncbi:PREDICTED: uncharacterized protein LOC104705261 isoform X1 [Camelina sativa]|uniref:Uncharacterized protein LOC104705261 isoform X1 n=1 Tax=Camelina sativa TaxID=90675 RepID=A0ABM0T1J7_CAMSA|nr:PREDICTED: uncharacterized protein LOC104705261 isoform X1 [Camelina sativa]XP_010419531.1 PREDICTED: uncharacterized protein LOC104705261 isoform X1 [Camelina sativa]XP_010419532.1 PREDICTED: uncharacterized protein LOC104705261 isoform X1 [Camelina sativa]XP_010419533.1 PREDICTED: uncharacterized protein LOC104705261 isoform X1 [Camelina sativa]XP_010419534.1 PREDICTED: uncharacterized protein LOC104705261 isoform X1 [Camelina sativa]
MENGHLPSKLSSMAQNQLIDSLTSHISLYHSHSSSMPNTSPNPRSAILRWFSSLSVHQRLSHLTFVDPKFVQILLQMLGHIRTKGPGSFIILPDLPSSSDLPSLCFKKSRGLISRVAESNESERFIFDSTRLFASREGERAQDCSCSVSSLDSVGMADGFLTDVDRFVEAMDALSNGAFLRGEESDLGSNWVELDWLKAKGYYSMEAFVANRLEVSLRLAWLNTHSGGKKRGIKLKEKLNAAAAAANAFWRKKASVDWWENLDAATHTKFWTCLFAKSAKSVIYEVLREANQAPQEEMWLFNFGGGTATARVGRTETLAVPFCDMMLEPNSVSRKPITVASNLSALYVLQEFASLLIVCQNGLVPVQTLFFSSLGSITTLVDCILRKLRGSLMVISIESVKVELLEDNTQKCSPSSSSNKRLGSTSRKHKGKTRNMKKPTPEAKSEKNVNFSTKSGKKDQAKLELNRNREATECKKVSTPSTMINSSEASAETMEVVPGLVARKGRTKKKRKEKNKNNKCTSLENTGEVNKSIVNSSAIEKAPECDSSGSSVNPLPKENTDAQIIREHGSSSCERNSSGTSTSVNSAVKCEYSGEEGLHDKAETHVISSDSTSADPAGDPRCKNMNSQKSRCSGVRNEKLTMPIGRSGTLEEGESHQIHHQRREAGYGIAASSSEFVSYEWHAVAPMYFSHVNSHLPTATDRLHLDVGHSLHAYVRQPFVSTVHHARNPSIEGSHKQVLSRPMPMSLDWPPMVHSNCGLTTAFACNYDSGILVDIPEQKNKPELGNECENKWMLEEDFEMHTVSGVDYNQYFGGGVMYWNPSDHLGTGFSRPPSLSSDDSSWAWHEAEMKRSVDDMVAFSSSYSANGLDSPTAASFCSPFHPLGPANQPLGYVVPGNELSTKILQAPPTTSEAAGEEEVSGTLGSLSADVEGNSGDSLPYPILRPIIIPNMSKSEYKRSYDTKSPNVPPTRREHPRIKRPPSPVVLCVPRAPRPPPPSPVSNSRARRGFPTVRSGSSSPRHWGMRGWFHDGVNWEEPCGAEVVLPWRNKSLAVRPIIQPLPGALLQDHLIAMSQLGRDQEHPDVAFPLQPPELLNCPTQGESLSLIHGLLNDEIDFFCKQVAAENMARKPYINWAIKRVTRSLQVLWPRSRTNIFGSSATGLSLPSSDVDLVVCLPPVRNLEPIKEAGILEGRNGIKETCLQHAARYLANQEWVKTDSLKTVENTAIPIIMLVVEVPCDLVCSIQSPKDGPDCIAADQDSNGNTEMVGFEGSAAANSLPTNTGILANAKSVRLDISFKTPSHTGLQTTQLVKDLTEQFPAATPLALVLKQFLADRTLDQSYSGGLSSYCLVLLITRFLQHEHHLGRSINQNFGGLLMDFLYFFGNVFDPRQMRVSVQGSGIYRNRERGYSIDPIHIDDPLFPTNNVGRNCFRIHQCIKAFSEAYSVLENELTCITSSSDSCGKKLHNLLPKIIPSIISS